MTEHRILLRAAVQGAYDLQQLRIAAGLRLCANFRSKLKLNAPPPTLADFGQETRATVAHVISKTSPLPPPAEPDSSFDPENDVAPSAMDKAYDANRKRTEQVSKALDDASPEQKVDKAMASIAAETEDYEEAMKLLDQLRLEYRRLTDGVAGEGKRRAKAKQVYTGTDLISSDTEKVLCTMYFGLEKEEQFQFKLLQLILDEIPIYTQWLRDVEGVGPAMASVIIAYFNPHKARHVSSMWKYAGLDVGPDGAGRSRRQEHLVERTYTAKDGTEKTRMSVTYEPFLKTKLTGVLAGCFLRNKAQPWREIYDGYKHRLESDPSRVKVTVAEWKKRYKVDPESTRLLWTPGRINNAAKRYMVKMFLQELYKRWRPLEGLTVSDPYPVAKLGQRPHAA